MSAIEEFVNKLTHEEALQIFKDYEDFDRTGVTGESALRIQTRAYLKSLGHSKKEADFSWMRILGHEVARRFALEYLKMTSGHSDQLTVTVSGPPGSGKTTLLAALNIFFKEDTLCEVSLQLDDHRAAHKAFNEATKALEAGGELDRQVILKEV